MATASLRSAFRNRSRVRAFSLVEVALAIGVISCSLISLIALLPSGLNAMRDSMDQTIRAQILQRISADLSMAANGSVGSGGSTAARELYFDEDAQFLGEAPKTAPAATCYVVQLLPDSPSMPGMADPAEIDAFKAHLNRIRVGISRAGISNAPVSWAAIQVSKK